MGVVRGVNADPGQPMLSRDFSRSPPERLRILLPESSATFPETCSGVIGSTSAGFSWESPEPFPETSPGVVQELSPGVLQNALGACSQSHRKHVRGLRSTQVTLERVDPPGGSTQCVEVVRGVNADPTQPMLSLRSRPPGTQPFTTDLCCSCEQGFSGNCSFSAK